MLYIETLIIIICVIDLNVKFRNLDPNGPRPKTIWGERYFPALLTDQPTRPEIVRIELWSKLLNQSRRNGKKRWTFLEKWDELYEKNEMNFMTKKMRWTLWKNEMDFVRKIRWTVLVKWDGLCEKNQMDFISKMRWTFWEKLDGLCEKNEINFFEEKNEMDFVRKMRWILWRKKWDGLYEKMRWTLWEKSDGLS